jgi:glycosyltransferase involved in cell wall biosynthesis
MRFHVLGIPHTASNKDYLCCAFTQKVVNLCRMLKMRGHTVFHYGNELSHLDCDENVVVTQAEDIGPPEQSGSFDAKGKTYDKFYRNTIAEIWQRKEKNDFLLCMWGAGHKPVADATNINSDLIVVEPGIGYPGGFFAPYKVFESYAVMHAYHGLGAVGSADRMNWYDVVIPNYYDPDDFTFKQNKGDYVAFLGLRSIGGVGKGIQIAADVCAEAKRKLIVAGPGQLPEPLRPDQFIHVEQVGMVNVKQRAKLLANAHAVITPSRFLEPFCGVHVESFFAGTPVISSDWGAFAEYNLHGTTGWRCRTFEQFVWAINNADQIKPQACRDWAMKNFTLDRVADMYEEYFNFVMDVCTGKGWYERHPERTNLDWLKRYVPQAA